jgi:NDP-sugar pyrophosphorylase family protein
MRHLTTAVPKPMITVAGRPFIDWQLEWLASEGVQRVVLSVGYKGDVLRSHLGEGRRHGVTITWVDEGEELRGTAGALRLALDCGALEERFFVLYGDSFLCLSLRDVWRAFEESSHPALMTVLRNEGRWDRSNVRYADGQVQLYDKGAAGPEFDYIDYGLSVLSRTIVESEVPSSGPWDLADVFHRLSRAGCLSGYEAVARFYEIGSPEGLVALEAHLTGSPPVTG